MVLLLDYLSGSAQRQVDAICSTFTLFDLTPRLKDSLIEGQLKAPNRKSGKVKIDGHVFIDFAFEKRPNPKHAVSFLRHVNNPVRSNWR